MGIIYRPPCQVQRELESDMFLLICLARELVTPSEMETPGYIKILGLIPTSTRPRRTAAVKNRAFMFETAFIRGYLF